LGRFVKAATSLKIYIPYPESFIFSSNLKATVIFLMLCYTLLWHLTS